MTPPQLATDTPVLNIPHPGEIGVFPVLWNEFYLSVFDSFDGRVGQGLDCDIPLMREIRLDHNAAAVSSWHFKLVRFDLLKQAERLHGFHNPRSRFESVKAAKSLGRLVVD